MPGCPTSARFWQMWVFSIQTESVSTSRAATPSRWLCPTSACSWQHKSRSDEISIAQHGSAGFEGGPDESRNDGTRNIWEATAQLRNSQRRLPHRFNAEL